MSCIVAALLAMNSSLVFADTYTLTLDKALDMAVETNASLRELESKIPLIEESVRKAKAGATQLAYAYENYRIYQKMYSEEDVSWEKYKDLTQIELIDEMIEISKHLKSPSSMAKVEEYLDDLEFIEYALMFGSDEPDMTEQEIYRKFAKDANLLGLQADNEKAKTLNNIEVIKGTVISQITQLYIGILDLEGGLKVQNELLDLRRNIQNELNAIYEEGLMSEFDLYSNEVELEKLKLEINKLELKLENLYLTLASALGHDIDNSYKLLNVEENESFEPLNLVLNDAVENNAAIKGLEIDQKYYQTNMDLFFDYGGEAFGNEYEDISYQLDKVTDELENSTWTLESNVYYAVGDMATKRLALKKAKTTFANATENLEKVIQQKELGLAKQTDVHSARLAAFSEYAALKQAERDSAASKIKYEMLQKYGVEY